MAVQFYSLEDRLVKNILFELNEDDFEVMFKVLVDFKKLTGIYIDPYGTTKIYPDHIKLIISIFENYLNQLNTKKNYVLKERLVKLSDEFRKVKGGLFVVGD
jgi:hypothetical protein